MSTPPLSDPKKLQSPRHLVQEGKPLAKKQGLSLDKRMRKLVWVTVGKTEHQAWLLEDLGDKENVLIEWESTKAKELVSPLDVRLEMPSRRSRQQNAQITDMKKLLKPPTPKELQALQNSTKKKKKKKTATKSASSKAKNGSRSSGGSKKKKRRQKAGAPKFYAEPSESEFEFEILKSKSAFKSTGKSRNKEADPGESSEEQEFDLDANDLNVPSSEGPVTKKRPRLPSRERLSDDDDSDLLDSEVDERPANSDDDEDPVIIKKSKYIKRISLTPRPGGGYDAEIMDSYHFPKLGSTALPKPHLGSAVRPVHVSVSCIDSSDDEAEVYRTIERVAKRKLSYSSETSKNYGIGEADTKVEIKVGPLANENELSVGSEAIKTAGVPASAKSVKKKVRESTVEVSIASLSSVPSLVSDKQTGIIINKTSISGNLPIAKTKFPFMRAQSKSEVAVRANEMVVSKRLVDASTANHILGSREEARTAESRPEKAVMSKKPAEGLPQQVVPEPSVPEKLFACGVAGNPTTSASVRQKPSESDTKSEGSDSSDDEDARIKRANAWMEIAKKNTSPRARSDKCKATAKEQGVIPPHGSHKTATNGTENQEAAGKRVSTSTAGTASDDNTDLPKKSVILRANERNSSDVEMEIERNQSQSSVVKKVAVSSSVAKAVATTDDIASSDDEAEFRKAKSTGPSASSNTLSSIHKPASPDEQGGSAVSPETRASFAKPSYDGNSSDDEAEIKRMKERMVVPPFTSRAKLPVGAGDSSDDEAELRRTKRRNSDPKRKKSPGRKRRKMPQAAKRRASSFTLYAESPFKKASPSRIAKGNCIGFSRAGAERLKWLLIKDFADRVAIWAVESSRETMKVAGSSTNQESPDISSKFVAESSLNV
jgi:hypothetical protein